MTDRGITPEWPLPDLRTPEQRDRDKAAVRKQVDVLSPVPAGTLAAGDIVDRIRARQRGLPAALATRFEQVTLNGSTSTVLVVADELVVETEQQQLTGFGAGLDRYERSDRPGRRTRVFRDRNKTVDDLLADAKQLRTKGVTASVNLVMPLGYVVKGDEFPARTSVNKPFTPGSGGSPVRVAVIDTGLTKLPRSDAWFTKITRVGTDELNQVEPAKKRNDYFAGHGTFTAGIIRQVSPTCEIMVYRFTKTDGLGTDIAAADMLIKAANDAAADAPGRPLIINASFGAPAVNGAPPAALKEAVDYIGRTYPDVLIVASAGNDGSEVPLYPAAFGPPTVRAVGALNPDLTGAVFSNRGTWVHCSAVGVGVVSTFVEGLTPPEDDLGVPDLRFPADAWATWTGTSFTAPQISGAVAALCAANGTLKPQAAFTKLLQGRPTLQGYGAKVHLLPGTPV